MKTRTKFLTALAAAGIAGLVMASAAMRQSLATDDTGDHNVTRVTAQLLEHSQFAHHPLDREFAGKFLDFYLDALDGQHSIFLQSDVQEFSADLPHLAARTSLEGDTGPARSIFARFVERITQRADFAAHLLQTETFEFTGTDALATDRDQAARPADLEAAQALWREQLRAEYLQEKLAGKKPAEIAENLAKRYARGAQTMKNFREDEILDVYLNALAHVYDPHSDYFGRAERDEFSIAMNLSFVGIGATLRLEDGLCKITDLVPGGPAARSGLLHPGDRIVAVAQPGKDPVDLTYMPLGDAVQLIRGPKDSKVLLTIIPSGANEAARKTITLIRDKVKLDEQRAKAQIVDLPDGRGGAERIGVIHLPAFYSTMGSGRDAASVSATADVARLLAKLKEEKIRGLILDLRNDGGGSLEEAIDLTGLFIPPGPVVQTRDAKGGISVGAAHDDAPLYDGPLIVLINRLSASASEIVAGALQDYGRAVIVGDSSTFGKGTVQSIVPLAPILKAEGLATSDDPGSLKLTISKFYRPSGASTQLKGVAADIVLPSLTDIPAIGEAKLKDPLPWDTISPADFAKDDRVGPFKAELRARSLRRQASDPEVAYLREDIARYQKNEAQKSVSLNEAERRQEMDADKKRDADRAQARRDRHETPATAYEITLDNVDHPGLPAPKTAAKLSASDAPPQDQDSHAENPQNPPPEDADLLETERMLVDYAKLLAAPPEPVTAIRQARGGSLGRE